jgi:hypothetical protein
MGPWTAGQDSCEAPSLVGVRRGDCDANYRAALMRWRRRSRPARLRLKIINARCRDPGYPARLQADLAEHASQGHELLAHGSRCRDPKIRRFTRGLLEHERALRIFPTTPDTPATNTAAERALPAGGQVLSAPRPGSPPTRRFASVHTGRARRGRARPRQAAGRADNPRPCSQGVVGMTALAACGSAGRSSSSKTLTSAVGGNFPTTFALKPPANDLGQDPTSNKGTSNHHDPLAGSHNQA